MAAPAAIAAVPTATSRAGRRGAKTAANNAPRARPSPSERPMRYHSHIRRECRTGAYGRGLNGAFAGKMDDVARDSRPLLVFFAAAHSGPARRMESLVAHLARKERARLRVTQVDV